MKLPNLSIIITCISLCRCIELDISREAKISKYDFQNDGSGSYYFQYQTSDGQSRDESAKLVNRESPYPQLVIEGSYSFTAHDGKVYTVTYTADKDGFHPAGDHIKVPPYTPWPTNLNINDYDGQYRPEEVKENPTKIYLPSTEKPLVPQGGHIDNVIVPTPHPSVANTYIPSTPSGLFTRDYIGPTPRTVRKPEAAASNTVSKVALEKINNALLEVIENNHSQSGVFD